MRGNNIDLADLENEKKYWAPRAYSNAKLANILFTNELHRRYAREGISAVSFHPGNVASNFARGSSSILGVFYRSGFSKLFLISPEKGASQLVRFATRTDWEPGAYYENHAIARRVNPQVRDMALAEQFWGHSLRLVEAFLPAASPSPASEAASVHARE
ncbi:hypothetical protein [Comamonas sp. JC664]|uniref:hypothetical protein n=1 Tax=Comamonas sp. JC664 TaxID=2801917 RepID=UPI0017489B2E|nr:hypothetical protein [Comamonas sp. JC664]MBL0698103.1 hypothetical protein [Comamonas sp. JC664]GHG88356.1 hypothetical protein GCM10012319_46930 [Comamonas sp. KCTC 72670]